MNNADRELLQQILTAAGSHAVEGFQALVKWEIANGITAIFGFGVGICTALFAFKSLLKWKPGDDFEHEAARIARIVGLLLSVVLLLISFTSFMIAIRDVIAPEGAAIKSLLNR